MMRNTMKKVLITLAGAIVCGSVMLAFTGQAAAAEAKPAATTASFQERPILSNDDCIKCHSKQPATIAANGGKHATEVTCLDCHEEHLPEGTNTIPKFSRCHEGERHFELQNCLGCHTDPHQPLNITLPDDAVAPCLTCHDEQGKEFKEFPSKHSQQSCTFCHDVHGKIPDCTDCHDPHVDGQVTADCLSCHPAHHPLQIVPSDDTPNSACGGCHGDEVEQLNETTTKHHELTCVFCHSGSHPTVPDCRDCHGEPHSPTMHKQMPDCLTCHMSPHKLVK